MAITHEQKKKFETICRQMGELLVEIRNTTPNAVLFLDDGFVDLLDWPCDIDVRDAEVLASGPNYWPGAGGGGR